jgi:hypothetical protein
MKVQEIMEWGELTMSRVAESELLQNTLLTLTPMHTLYSSSIPGERIARNIIVEIICYSTIHFFSFSMEVSIINAVIMKRSWTNALVYINVKVYFFHRFYGS